MKKTIYLIIIALFLSANLTAQVKRIEKNVKLTKVQVRALNADDLIKIIHSTARNWGIEEKLFENLIRKESAGAVCVSSNKGARGITQIVPDTARRLGLRVDSQIDERCDLVKSLNAGAKYLRYLLELFKGDRQLALAGYNAGEGAVIKYGYKIPPYRETLQYVELISYWTYGKQWMALEKAFNQRTAYPQLIGLYNGKSSRHKFLVTQKIEIITPPTEEKKLSDETIGEVKNPNLVEKSPRKIVRVADLEPKISTTLIFNK